MSQPSQRGPAKPLTSSAQASKARLSGGNPKATSSSSPVGTAQPPRSVPSPVSQRHVQPSTSKSQSPYSGAQTRSPAGLLPNFDILAHGMATSMDRSSTGKGSSLRGRIASTLGRGSDEERARILKAITEKLQRLLPRLNPSGLEIIAQRVGLDVTFDPEKGTRPDGSKDCYIAGKTFLLEVGFESERRVRKANLTVSGAATDGPQLVSTEDFASTASEVLQHSLTNEQVTLGPSSLTAFAENLDRIAMLDRVSSGGGSGFNAFQAITGVYYSLKKLHDYELRKAAFADRRVLSKMSGRPMMNAWNTIGVTLDYWLSDRNNGAKYPFSLSIECENTLLYMPDTVSLARVSPHWISDEIAPADVQMGPNVPMESLVQAKSLPTESLIQVESLVQAESLPWLEPNFTQEPEISSLPAKSEGQHAVPKTMPSRFVAKLNPPLIVPEMAMGLIEQAVGISVADFIDFDYLPLYHDLVLGTETDVSTHPHRTEVEVFSKSRHENPKGEWISYRNTLHVPLQRATKVETLGFSHPKQLVAILPVSCPLWLCIR
jgi:hypothetical protein